MTSRISYHLSFVSFAALILAGCGGDGASSVAVTISPSSTRLFTGAVQVFSADITGISGGGVTWSASGGTITTAGSYTAPLAAGAYTVRATSFDDPSKTATAIVTVVQPTVAVTPQNATVLGGETLQYVATVDAPGPVRGVTWTVSPSSAGTIDADGLFTGVVLTGQTTASYTVTARSLADPDLSGTARGQVTRPVP